MAAPKFESNLRDMEKVLIGRKMSRTIICLSNCHIIYIYLSDNPDFMATMGKKSSDLDQRLKQVYVTSQDPKVRVMEE